MATTKRDVGGEPPVDRPSSQQGYIAWSTYANHSTQDRAAGADFDALVERRRDQQAQGLPEVNDPEALARVAAQSEARIRAVIRETQQELRDVVAMYHDDIDQAIALRVAELNEVGNQRLDEFDRRFRAHAESLENRRPTTLDEIEQTVATLDSRLTAFVEQTTIEVRRHLDQVTQTSQKAMRRAVTATVVGIVAFLAALGAGLAAVLLAP